MRSPLTVTDPPVVLRPGDEPADHESGVTTAVWDVDGTLVFGDTLLPFLSRFTGPARLAAILLESAVRESGRSNVKAAVLQRVLGGRERSEVDRVARQYVVGTVLPRIRPDCLTRWSWHRAQGHRMVLASASLDLYLLHLGARLGAHEVICTDMATVNGRLTGALATPNCRGEEKAARVRALGAGPIWAYANGSADRPLLEMADVGVKVGPFRTLPMEGQA